MVAAKITIVHSIVALVALHELVVDIKSHQIENGNNISGIVFQLLVELRVESVNMLAVDVEGELLGLRNRLQLLNIQWLLRIPVVINVSEVHLVIFLHDHETGQELLELI